MQVLRLQDLQGFNVRWFAGITFAGLTLFQCQKKFRSLDYASLNSNTQDISNAINSSKLKYHERLALNLNDPKTAPKTYWKILKTFVNGTKIPLIPPLLVGNQLVTDFLVKANLFNDYFSQQCTTVDNDSSIPPNITFATEQKLSTLEFCTDDIVKIIKSLDPNKALVTMKYLFGC